MPGTTAFAYGDLATGKLGASVSTNFAGTNAKVTLSEKLTFTIPGATADTLTPISFTINLEGLMGGRATDRTRMQAIYQFGQAGIAGGYVSLNVDNDPAGNQFINDCGGPASLTGFGMQAVCSFTVKGATPVVDIVNNLDVTASSCGNEGCFAFVDYSNTSTLGLRIPNGVTYTSDSGVFLTNAATATVPEPASWAMMMIGFGLIGAAQRRRTNSLQTASA